jgi:hypothetical protein
MEKAKRYGTKFGADAGIESGPNDKHMVCYVDSGGIILGGANMSTAWRN